MSKRDQDPFPVFTNEASAYRHHYCPGSMVGICGGQYAQDCCCVVSAAPTVTIHECLASVKHSMGSLRYCTTRAEITSSRILTVGPGGRLQLFVARHWLPACRVDNMERWFEGDRYYAKRFGGLKLVGGGSELTSL